MNSYDMIQLLCKTPISAVGDLRFSDVAKMIRDQSDRIEDLETKNKFLNEYVKYLQDGLDASIKLNKAYAEKK